MKPDHEVVSTLDASFGRLQGCSGQDMRHGHSHLVPVAFGGNDTRGPIDVLPACLSHRWRGDFETEALLVHPPVMGEDLAFTLTAGMSKSASRMPHEQGALLPVYRDVVPFDTTQISHPENRSRPEPGDPSPSLAARGHPPAIAFNARQDPDAWDDRAGPLDCMSPQGQAVLVPGWAVRRIMPVEAERLQGFPDGFTLVPYREGRRGNLAKDGPRYKALGNSMAVPCVGWVLSRLRASWEARA